MKEFSLGTIANSLDTAVLNGCAFYNAEKLCIESHPSLTRLQIGDFSFMSARELVIQSTSIFVYHHASDMQSLSEISLGHLSFIEANKVKLISNIFIFLCNMNRFAHVNANGITAGLIVLS